MNQKWIVATLFLIAAGLIAGKYLRPSQTGEPTASSPGSSRSQPEVPRPAGKPTALVPAPAHYEIPPGTSTRSVIGRPIGDAMALFGK